MYNPQIHHRRSIRLKGYDYSQAGLYFITICCQNRICLFGHIQNGQMILNDAGKIANECWLEIPKHFPHVILHEHVIMPNHIHGIIELTVWAENFPPDKNTTTNENISSTNDNISANENIGAENGNVGAKNISNETVGAKNISNETIGAKNISNETVWAKNISPIRSPSKTIGAIVRGFKIGVTKWMRHNTNVHDVWQRNYYENIIRNEQSYATISDYIRNNPAKWNADKFFNEK